MRPHTLAEVAARTIVDQDWDHHLREFLDVFYRADGDRAQQSRMIQDEPELLNEPKIDAMLGAAGEHLPRRWNLEIPRWVRHPARYLDRPIYVPDEASLRQFLAITSPVAFRTRLIFTGPEPLQRARFPYGKGTAAFAWSWPPTSSEHSQPIAKA